MGTRMDLIPRRAGAPSPAVAPRVALPVFVFIIQMSSTFANPIWRVIGPMPTRTLCSTGHFLHRPKARPCLVLVSRVNRLRRTNHLQDHHGPAATPRIPSILRCGLRPAAPGKVVRRAAGLPRGFGVFLQPRLEGGLRAGVAEKK